MKSCKLSYLVKLHNVTLLITFLYELYIRYRYLKVNKFILFLMCKDTYVPHKLLLQMFITYLMYMFDTFIKVKSDAEKNV